jgi:hypothetical protein
MCKSQLHRRATESDLQRFDRDAAQLLVRYAAHHSPGFARRHPAVGAVGPPTASVCGPILMIGLSLIVVMVTGIIAYWRGKQRGKILAATNFREVQREDRLEQKRQQRRSNRLDDAAISRLIAHLRVSVEQGRLTVGHALRLLREALSGALRITEVESLACTGIPHGRRLHASA